MAGSSGPPDGGRPETATGAQWADCPPTVPPALRLRSSRVTDFVPKASRIRSSTPARGSWLTAMLAARRPAIRLPRPPVRPAGCGARPGRQERRRPGPPRRGCPGSPRCEPRRSRARATARGRNPFPGSLTSAAVFAAIIKLGWPPSYPPAHSASGQSARRQTLGRRRRSGCRTRVRRPGDHWPFGLCCGGYERGAPGRTLTGMRDARPHATGTQARRPRSHNHARQHT